MKGFQESDHKECHKNGCLGKMRKGPRVIMREANSETSDRGTWTERIIIGRAFSFFKGLGERAAFSASWRNKETEVPVVYRV